MTRNVMEIVVEQSPLEALQYLTDGIYFNQFISILFISIFIHAIYNDDSEYHKYFIKPILYWWMIIRALMHVLKSIVRQIIVNELETIREEQENLDILRERFLIVVRSWTFESLRLISHFSYFWLGVSFFYCFIWGVGENYPLGNKFFTITGYKIMITAINWMYSFYKLQHTNIDWDMVYIESNGIGFTSQELNAYSQILKNGEEYKNLNEDGCIVCMEDYTKESEIRRFNFCHHHFHKSCIDIWMKSHDKCPLCKQLIIGENNTANEANNGFFNRFFFRN